MTDRQTDVQIQIVGKWHHGLVVTLITNLHRLRRRGDRAASARCECRCNLERLDVVGVCQVAICQIVSPNDLQGLEVANVLWIQLPGDVLCQRVCEEWNENRVECLREQKRYYESRNE